MPIVQPPASSGSSVEPTINTFRLSTSTTSVYTSEISADTTTVGFRPLAGPNGRISLYDGTSTWTTLDSAGLTLNLNTLSGGATGTYDIFAYNNSGTLAAEILAWTNATTRATALTQVNGVWCKSGATTRRWIGTAALRGGALVVGITGTSGSSTQTGRIELVNADNRQWVSVTAYQGSTSTQSLTANVSNTLLSIYVLQAHPVGSTTQESLLVFNYEGLVSQSDTTTTLQTGISNTTVGSTWSSIITQGKRVYPTGKSDLWLAEASRVMSHSTLGTKTYYQFFQSGATQTLTLSGNSFHCMAYV